MGSSHIGKANIGAQVITLTNNGEPNWSIIPTAGKSGKSQNEFVSEIKELARKEAMTMNKTELNYISRQRLQLHAEYLSDVAPRQKDVVPAGKKYNKEPKWQPGNWGIKIERIL